MIAPGDYTIRVVPVGSTLPAISGENYDFTRSING